MGTSVPNSKAPLVDRESERASIWALLTKPGVRFLTITGPGGVGKTRLALAATAELANDFEDGAYFISMADLWEPELAISIIANALGIQDSGNPSTADSVSAKLASANLLLVVDSLEQVAAAARHLVQILERCPGVRVLATSRVPLRVKYERAFPIFPLPIPDTTQLPPLHNLRKIPSVNLLVQLAQAADPDFALTESNALAIAGICARLDGLPLAIELAAARLRVLSPTALVQRLSNPLALLVSNDPTLPVRQQTLRGAIAGSEELLSSNSRRLFRCLSVFAGGIAAEAIEAICGKMLAARAAACEVLDGLSELLDGGLLHRAMVDGEPRFIMPNTICEYAWEELEAAGEAEATHRRHAAYFLMLAEEGAEGLRGSDQETWLKRLRSELENFRVALGWSLMHDPEANLRLVAALWRCWYAGGYLSEGERWLERALATSAGEKSVARVRALNGLGVLVWATGEVDRALGLQHESLSLAQEIDDAWGMAAAHGDQAILEFQRDSDAARARVAMEHVLEQFHALGDRYSESIALGALGNIALTQGALNEAAVRFHESFTIARQIGELRNQALCLFNLAQIARLEGDLAGAATHFRESLTLAHRLDLKEDLLYCLAGIGGIVVERRQFERSARLFGAACAFAAKLGITLQPIEQAQVDRDVEAARSALSHAAFSQEWTRGRSLSMDEAVTEALESTRPPGQITWDHGLSARELEVVKLLVAGSSIGEMAGALFISSETVKTHMKHIHRKLGLRSRAAVTAYALDHGLV